MRTSKDMRKNIDDKIMSEEEWRAMIPHESPAEIPPVPTYKQVVQYVYETALKS